MYDEGGRGEREKSWQPKKRGRKALGEEGENMCEGQLISEQEEEREEEKENI